MSSLVSALPSDFARVEERFATIRSEILAAFRAEKARIDRIIASGGQKQGILGASRQWKTPENNAG